ncbi:MAG: hypothetical protein WC881_11105 [Elusimicrobiota bacterium]
MQVVFALLMLSVQASAGPYFRLIDPKAPKVVAGVYADPTGSLGPDSGAAVPLVTHSTRDGALFRSIQADWSPLALGGGRSAGGSAFLAVGPVANLAPVVKGAAVSVLDLLAPGQYANLRQLLAPVPGDGRDVSISFGPAWQFKPVDGGRWVDPKSWRGQFRLFAGAALQF